MVKAKKSDVRIHDAGSQFMVTPVSQAAQAWVDANVQLEGWQWLGPAFAVDPRYVDNLVAGMMDAGLTITGRLSAGLTAGG